MIMEALTALVPAHPGADRVELERAFDWHAPGRTDLLCRSPRALEDTLACNLAIYAGSGNYSTARASFLLVREHRSDDIHSVVCEFVPRDS